MSSDPIEVLRELRDAELDDYFYPSKEQRAALDAAIASLAAPKPDGEWVLVPREPSEAMLDAGKRCVTPLYVYDAMLASAPKPPPMNDNAVAVNESAPVNDKPESAEVVCPECNGKGWTSEAGVAFDDPVICPDCAGSGRAEHSITANESAPPRPEASAPEGVEGVVKAMRMLAGVGIPVKPECVGRWADQLEALAQQPAAVDEAWQVQLADALECFWNAALGGVREYDDSTASAVMSGMVHGVAAVADRLRERAGKQQGGES